MVSVVDLLYVFGSVLPHLGKFGKGTHDGVL